MFGGAMPMPMPVPAAGYGGPMPMPMGASVGLGGGVVPEILNTTPGVTGEGRRQAVAATRRRTAAGQEGRGEMCQRMRYIMFEIDEHNGRFLADRPADQPFQFLDVCCCPGGFSTYSLEAGKAPRKGIGLSLPPMYGGHLPAIPERALLVAQLVVMANNLARGGLLVLRLNMFPDMFTVGVLGLLRQVFAGDVASYKPRSCHVHVGSYYLVCTNFDPVRAYQMQALLDKRLAQRPRTGRFTNTCGRIFANAFREPRGFLHQPGSLALLSAPVVAYDPLPETLLELRQQAHMQAVQLGMAGEWVHGLMRGTRDEAGEAGGEDALSLFMRTADDPNVVLEGGFEDPEPAPGALLQMSGYQPRLGLLAIEVEDDETLSAMCEYLGW
eukprot:XP_001691217.1 predicted protein [Chlamydomonas reinhardtii]